MTSPCSSLTLLLPELWRFALRLSQHREGAQVLVQQTCVLALERLPQWPNDTPPLPWLYSILYGLWARDLAEQASLDDGDANDAPELPALQDGFELGDDADDTDRFRQVVEAVSALPPSQRVVMLLVAVEGLSYREASEVLDVPIDTLLSRLSRARLTIGARFAAPLHKGHQHAA